MATGLHINLDSNTLRGYNNTINDCNERALVLSNKIDATFDSIKSNVTSSEISSLIRASSDIISESNTILNQNVSKLTTFLQEQSVVYDDLLEDAVTKINNSISVMESLASEVASTK